MPSNGGLFAPAKRKTWWRLEPHMTRRPRAVHASPRTARPRLWVVRGIPDPAPDFRTTCREAWGQGLKENDFSAEPHSPAQGSADKPLKIRFELTSLTTLPRLHQLPDYNA